MQRPKLLLRLLPSRSVRIANGESVDHRRSDRNRRNRACQTKRQHGAARSVDAGRSQPSLLAQRPAEMAARHLGRVRSDDPATGGVFRRNGAASPPLQEALPTLRQFEELDCGMIEEASIERYMIDNMEIQEDHKREQLIRKAFHVEWVNTGRMVIEAAVAIGAGIAAQSLTLIAFGADSFIELVSAGLLLWRLNVELIHGQRVSRAAGERAGEQCGDCGH